MRRKIVKIDEEKCTGCGICIPSCAEGAIQLIDGKARLVSEVYCDGLGACLGECPEGAISIEERDAEEFSEDAVKKHLAKQAREEASRHPAKVQSESASVTSFCPSARIMDLGRAKEIRVPGNGGKANAAKSQLSHWPVKLKLVPPSAPFLEGADLMMIADCVPFVFADLHQKFLSGHSVVIGCPKFDDQDADFEKLTAILRTSDVRSLTVVHAEVPCCFGYFQLAQQALTNSGKEIPLRQVIIGINGEIKLDKAVSKPENRLPAHS
jgi:Pyruvate/2-oxoacid:ferredoxin oxidoreductase delta subunit